MTHGCLWQKLSCHKLLIKLNSEVQSASSSVWMLHPEKAWMNLFSLIHQMFSLLIDVFNVISGKINSKPLVLPFEAAKVQTFSFSALTLHRINFIYKLASMQLRVTQSVLTMSGSVGQRCLDVQCSVSSHHIALKSVSISVVVLRSTLAVQADQMGQIATCSTLADCQVCWGVYCGLKVTKILQEEITSIWGKEKTLNFTF